MIAYAIIPLDRMVTSMSMPKLLRIKPLDAYPIGSIYMSLDATSPADIFGGVWERLKDRFLMPAGDTYAAGTTGGSAEQTLLVDNMPAHTHTRGTMEITGNVAHDPITGWTRATRLSGAFYEGPGTGARMSGGSTASETICIDASFAASRSWTGETSSEGGGGEFLGYTPIYYSLCMEKGWVI